MTVWWSKAILIGAVVGAVCLPLGALGTKFGIWDFRIGFGVLQIGVVLAAVMLVGGIVGLILANKRGLTSDRGGIVLGTIVSALVLALMGVQFNTANSVPPIHNISTDTADPPQFDVLVAERGSDSNPLEYDAAELAPKQREAYPFVKTLPLEVSPADALARSEEALKAMGLAIAATDPEQGIVEATDTTFWFGFKDDVVVRVRAADGGSLVDVRSVSRVGVSDLGANAARIGEFLKAMGAS